MPRDTRQEARQRLGHRIAGKYLLKRVLGVGGMGAVYAARHEFTERMVALKLLHANIAATHVHAQRFLQEATASAAIGHPGIAEVLDAGRDDDGGLYVAFELLEGQDLGAAISGRRVEPVRMLEIGLELIDALEAAHEKGFIHRDIKPANIFLLDQPFGPTSVKLLDFGIARRMGPSVRGDGLTQAGSVVGTPYYMSPEQMCGEAVDGRADLWALAVVLYYGLTGKLPFAGKSYVSLLTEMLRKGPPALPPRADVPAGVESVLKRALTTRLEDRFPSAAGMRMALKAVVPKSSPPADVPTPSASIPTPGRRTPAGRRTPPSDTAPSSPTTDAAPPWQQALEDIEGEIRAIEGRPPMAGPAAPGRRDFDERRPWFGKKR